MGKPKVDRDPSVHAGDRERCICDCIRFVHIRVGGGWGRCTACRCQIFRSQRDSNQLGPLA
jgi:hypothetical protein